MNTASNPEPPPTGGDVAAASARPRFDTLLRQALADGSWQRLVLSVPQAPAAGVLRVVVRPLLLRGVPSLSFVSSHATKDVTQNLPLEPALAHIGELLTGRFRVANLLTLRQTFELRISKRGSAHLAVHARPASAVPEGSPEPAPAVAPHEPLRAAPVAPHDRVKQRWLTPDRPFLQALGVTTAQHQLVPAMARKWKQINKFLEVFAHALARSPLAGRQRLHVVDFGAGKAYLSFAVHDWLTHQQHRAAQVTGVELRPDLVAQGQQTAAALGLVGMRLVQGDVRDGYDGPIDVMIALHACDTATDHAIALGIRAGAQVILCSPCCHKQLRPQLLSPHPLRSVFQHGIHAEQQAEMLTDSLRALLLQAQGYDTQVFEFVALEHTRKNKMILAVKRGQPQPAAAADALAQVAELKRYFGVREQCLETLLQA